jgi:ferredoxin-NADP reductase
MSILFRRPGALIALGTSALGGAAYRYSTISSPSDAALSPTTFTPYTLVDKQTVSSTSAIFTLRNRNGAPESESAKEAWKRSLWSVQIKQPQLQIARAYTPLPPTNSAPADDEAPHELRLLIRQEGSGEVSTYLHRLPEQSTIELRGPNVECELPRDIKEVIFLAGGTGIAPAMQVAQALSRSPGSRMHILWANRRREECLGGVNDERDTQSATGSRLPWWKSLLGYQQPTQETLVDNVGSQAKGLIVRELDALKERFGAPSRGMTIQYYVDEEKTFMQARHVGERLAHGASEETGSKVIFVSGPDGFIEAWAGKKLWQNGREVQGPLGGILSQMDLKGWSVYKL